MSEKPTTTGEPTAEEATREASGEVWVASPPLRVWRALTEGPELER